MTAACIEVGGSGVQTVLFDGDEPPRIVGGVLAPAGAAVAIAVPGWVADGRVLAASNLGWFDVDPARQLGLDAPAQAVCNDAEAAALGESVLRDDVDLVYVGLGTGVGGAIVSGGAVVAANRFGHTTGFSALVCPCGQTGCLETVAAGWSLPDPLDDAHLERAARAIATAVEADDLATPRLVVLGGGLARRYPGLVGMVAAAMPGRVVEPSAAPARAKSAAGWGLRALIARGDAASRPRTAQGARVRLEYEVLGSGPEVVWLHGLSGSLEESRLLAGRLAERYRVLWYSTRGHGRSQAPTGADAWSYDAIADDLAAMIAHVGFTRPLLAGGSHGANTILRHEARHPGAAAGLLLVAPGTNAVRTPPRWAWAVFRAHLAWAGRGGPDGIVKAISGHHPDDPGADHEAVAAARTHDFAVLPVALRRIPNQVACPPDALRAFQVPTTVVGWRGDHLLHPFRIAARVAAAIPGAELVEVPRAPRADRKAEAETAARTLLPLLDRLAVRAGVA